MTEKDFEVFVNRLFISFPDVYEWVHQNSPDPIATQATWLRTLKECNLDECLMILDDWMTGKRPVFKAYERSHVALLIRQSVFFDRDKAAKRNRTDAIGDEYVKTNRRNYRPAVTSYPELATIYAKVHELNRLHREGVIDEQERKRRINEFANGAKDESVSSAIEG